jgi:hypothetical protein
MSRRNGYEVDISHGTIRVEEFRERFLAVVRRGGGGLPRKSRDRHILFRAVVQSLTRASYPEPELNEALQNWLSLVDVGSRVDHVSLRRYLVDAGYLRRDSGGNAYVVCPAGREEVLFDAGVQEIDAVEVIQSAQERAAERKRKWARPSD